MLCPLKFSGLADLTDLDSGAGKKPDDLCQCEKADCEWWDKAEGRCSLRSIAIVLKKISQKDPLESL